MKNSQVIILAWMALIFASLTMFGNYYLYDSVAYVSVELEKLLSFTDAQFGGLYSMYSVAAIIVLIFSGIFIDKFGTRKSIFIFGLICALSGFITAFSTNAFFMLASRFVLGFGAEPLIVAVTVAIAKWFKGKLLGLALGMNLFIARLGSIAADWSRTWGGKYYDGTLESPLLLAASIGLLCVGGALFYYFIELKAEKSGILDKAGETDKLELKSLFSFSPSFWFVVLLCVTFYSAIFPFRGFAPKYFQYAHDLAPEVAGKLNSILPTTALFATPLIGLLIDLIGKRASMMFIGAALIVPVFLLMAYSGVTLYVPVAMLGIAFSLIPAVMWPSVAYIVEEKRLGTGYALMTLIQQVGVALFALLIGWANDTQQASKTNPEGYNLGMWLFSILGILAFVFSFLLFKAETGPNSHGLEKSDIE